MAKCETKYPVFNRLFIRFREIPGIYKICPLKIGTEFYLIWSVDIFDFYRVIVLRKVLQVTLFFLENRIIKAAISLDYFECVATD